MSKIDDYSEDSSIPKRADNILTNMTNKFFTTFKPHYLTHYSLPLAGSLGNDIASENAYRKFYDLEMNRFYKILPDELKLVFSCLDTEGKFQLYLFLTQRSKTPPQGIEAELLHRVLYKIESENNNNNNKNEENDCDCDHCEDEESDYENAFDDLCKDMGINTKVIDKHLDIYLEKNLNYKLDRRDHKDHGDTQRHRCSRKKHSCGEGRKIHCVSKDKDIKKTYLYPEPFKKEEKDVIVIPSIDILDSTQEYVIYINISGVSKTDVSVMFNVERNHLILSGLIKDHSDDDLKNLRVNERPTGKFERIIPLPLTPRIKDNSITSKLKDGVLIVYIPKYSSDLNEIPVTWK